MSKKVSGVNYSKAAPVRTRRLNVIQRLENQLSSKVKTKKIDGINQTVDLTESDINRINKEIKILKERI